MEKRPGGTEDHRVNHMPLTILHPDKPSIFGFSSEELDSLAREWGWPAFRAAQVRNWVYQKLIDRPAEMTNLAKADRALLEERLAFATGEISKHQQSSDGTRKLLLTWGDANAETVMIPDGDRRTACVSSQVGCPVGCKFCASGVNGVKGNLTAGQIVEQVYRLNQIFESGSGFRVSGSGPAPAAKPETRNPIPSPTSSSWAWASPSQTTPTSCRRSASSTILNV